MMSKMSVSFIRICWGPQGLELSTLMDVFGGCVQWCLTWFALLSCHLALHGFWQPPHPPTEQKHNALVGPYHRSQGLVSLFKVSLTGFPPCISSWQELTAPNLLQEMSAALSKLCACAEEKHIDYITCRLSGCAQQLFFLYAPVMAEKRFKWIYL